MTIGQKINQLLLLLDIVVDQRQKDALMDAIVAMQSVTELYIKAYMRGYHDAKQKGMEA